MEAARTDIQESAGAAARLPHTPQHDPLISHFSQLSGRVGIFGGTFDPPHAGHLNLALNVKDALNLDAVVFIPTAQNPLKANAPGASAADRIEMLKAMLRDQPGLFVSPIEIERVGPSYTVETLAAIKEEIGPGSEMFFLVGTDLVSSLPRWNRAELLPHLATIVSYPRQESSENSAQSSDGKFPLLSLSADLPSINVSSTELRAALRSGDLPDSIPLAVQDYILRHDLYSSEHGGQK